MFRDERTKRALAPRGIQRWEAWTSVCQPTCQIAGSSQCFWKLPEWWSHEAVQGGPGAMTREGWPPFVLENSGSWTEGWKVRGEEKTGKTFSVLRSGPATAASRWLKPEDSRT